MIQTLTQLAPIFVYFGLGVLLRQLFLAEKAHGDFLLRLVFNISLPLLIITTICNIPISFDKALLPIANIAVSLACMLISLLVIKILKFERRAAGCMLVNTMMVNSMFMLPFILAIYGSEGFTDAILFNLGNAFLIATYVYVLVSKYEGKEQNNWAMLVSVLKSPLIWAVVIGVVLSTHEISLGYHLELIINPLAQLTSPLIMIALGILVSFKFTLSKVLISTVAIRMLMGVLFGTSIAAYLGLEGVTFIVASLCSAAPLGANAVAYLTVEKLDAELSDDAISISILLGLIYIPLLIVLFGGA